MTERVYTSDGHEITDDEISIKINNAMMTYDGTVGFAQILMSVGNTASVHMTMNRHGDVEVKIHPYDDRGDSIIFKMTYVEMLAMFAEAVI